mgnify:FL=1
MSLQQFIVINPTSRNKVLHFPPKMALVCTFPIFLGFSGCVGFSDASGRRASEKPKQPDNTKKIRNVHSRPFGGNCQARYSNE